MVTSNNDFAYNTKIEGDIVVTRADAVINWLRSSSIWPMPMGLACCGIELMASGDSRFDIARFGAEVMRFSPRQADCMIVAGACASSGGMYRSYATLQGVDRIIPVDVYVSGCPPRPEALLDALIKMQAKIKREPGAQQLLSSA